MQADGILLVPYLKYCYQSLRVGLQDQELNHWHQLFSPLNAFARRKTALIRETNSRVENGLVI